MRKRSTDNHDRAQSSASGSRPSGAHEPAAQRRGSGSSEPSGKNQQAPSTDADEFDTDGGGQYEAESAKSRGTRKSM